MVAVVDVHFFFLSLGWIEVPSALPPFFFFFSFGASNGIVSFPFRYSCSLMGK